MTPLAAFLIAVAALIFPPCATEDSVNCTWNATAQGNGTGHSLVDVGGTAYPLGG